MQKPKIGQRVVWKSSIPEEQLRGQVSFVSAISVGITFKDMDPQKHVKGEGSGGPFRITIGVQKGNEKFFPWDEYERYFSEVEEN